MGKGKGKRVDLLCDVKVGNKGLRLLEPLSHNLLDGRGRLLLIGSGRKLRNLSFAKGCDSKRLAQIEIAAHHAAVGAGALYGRKVDPALFCKPARKRRGRGPSQD